MYLKVQCAPLLRKILLLSLILILQSGLSDVVHADTSLPPVITLGAIIETGDEHLIGTLLQAVARINQNQVLPRTSLNITTYTIKHRDSFNAAKLVCRLLHDKVWAIFSSKSESINWYVRSLANELQVPHLSVHWNYRSKFLFNINQENADEEALNGAPGSGSGFGFDSGIQNGENGMPGLFTGGNGPSGGNFGWQGNSQPSPASNLNWMTSKYGSLNRQNRSRSQIYANQQHDFQPLGGYQHLPGVPIETHFTVNMYPDSNQLGEAFMDFVLHRNWKSFTLIYDKYEGLIAMKDLLAISSATTRRQVKLSVIEFPENEHSFQPDTEANEDDYQPLGRGYRNVEHMPGYIYKKLLKNIRKSEHNFVLFLSPDKAINFLREAYETKRMSEYDNFLIASMDIHMMDLSEFQKKTLANITGLSVLTSSPQDDLSLGRVTDYRDKFYGKRGQQQPTIYHTLQNHQISTTEGLIYDAISLFARTLDDLDRRLTPDEVYDPMVSCDNLQAKWHFGAIIAKHMKAMRIEGMTGPIAFDTRGHRVDFTIDIMQLKRDGLKNIAKWTKKNGIESSANYTFYDSYKQILEAMKYKELKITIPPNNQPYIYLKQNHEEFTGNDKFEGFCVDLLNMITEVFQKDFQSDFKYQIRFVADGKYGRPNKETGEWDGMIGELMRHQADLAIADLTATYLRETAVDFTMPFMNLGIAILFKKTAIPDPELFSFLKPLSVEVWLYLASAFLGISIIFWLLSRISPYEWVSPHSCDPDPLELENQFSIGNSLWFTIGSLMQQGSDLAPKALSTRILAGVWWFFTLIMISSYTANLAASLTLSRMAPAISNVEDLAKQTAIQYGCKKGGSTHEFFQNSNHTTYQRMFNTMESNQEVYINKIEDAIERVKKGGYAYLAESSTIEHLIQRKCDLYQVGTWLDNKGYGIATPTDSPYRTPISNAIVVLQDRGLLYELKKRWWVEYGGGLCMDPPTTSSQELNIENVGGVFVVLGGGVAIGCLFGALEFIWKSLKIARDERDSIGKLIWLEIVRICTGGGSSRPVYQAQSSSNNLNPSTPNGEGTPNGNGTMNSPGLTKASSFTSMGGLNSPLSSPPNYEPFRYNAMSPPPAPHPFHQRQQPSYSSYDSQMPLLGPSSAPSKSLSRVNSNVNSGMKSPTAYSNVLY